MTTLLWILLGGFLMSVISLAGGVALVLRPDALRRIVLPLVAFSGGALLGGAFLHLIPASLEERPEGISTYGWVLAGFVVFFGIEQFLHWHHHQLHREAGEKPLKPLVAPHQPLTYLILTGDALHNFLDGVAMASAFVIDVRLGLITLLAEVAHEVPQELGDFAVLVHGGCKPGRALLFNWLSGLTFIAGSLLAWLAARRMDVSFLTAFAAGTFIYIAASDLVPEVRGHRDWRANLLHFVCFGIGILLMVAVGWIEP